MRTFLTNDVLQTAYEVVTRATEDSNEDELSIFQRIQKTARVCRHVFTPVEMGYCHNRGLHESVRECVRKEISHLYMYTPADIILVREKLSDIENY